MNSLQLKERDRIIGNFRSMASYTDTVTRRALEAIMLETGGWVVCRGEKRLLKSEYLGGGAHRVYSVAEGAKP